VELIPVGKHPDKTVLTILICRPEVIRCHDASGLGILDVSPLTNAPGSLVGLIAVKDTESQVKPFLDALLGQRVEAEVVRTGISDSARTPFR